MKRSSLRTSVEKRIGCAALLWVFAAMIASAPAQIIVDGDAILPSEIRNVKPPEVRVVPPAPMPLEPQEVKMKIRKGYERRYSSDSMQVVPQTSIPLTSPDVPNVVPMTVNPLDRYAKVILSTRPQDTQYRVISMQLNDFGVAMSRRAGLRYIYNPSVRGVVNGIFKNTDPIHMLRVAGKSNGYRLVIKDGVNAEFQKEEEKK